MFRGAHPAPVVLLLGARHNSPPTSNPVIFCHVCPHRRFDLPKINAKNNTAERDGVKVPLVPTAVLKRKELNKLAFEQFKQTAEAVCRRAVGAPLQACLCCTHF